MNEMNPIVLIIEDDPMISFGILSTLQKNNILNVKIAHSPKEALELFSEIKFDILLVDINLESNIDGIDLAYKLLMTNTVGTLFITGNVSNEVISKASKVCCGAFLSKPIKESDLIANLKFKYKEVLLFRKSFGNCTDSFVTMLAKAIKVRRSTMNISQFEASEKIGINYRHYQNIEAGKVYPKLNTYLLLLNFYKLDPRSIVCFGTNCP